MLVRNTETPIRQTIDTSGCNVASDQMWSECDCVLCLHYVTTRGVECYKGQSAQSAALALICHLLGGIASQERGVYLLFPLHH